MGEDQGVRSTIAAPPRRRGLDRTWQVEQELDFESRTAPDEALEASKEKVATELCPEEEHFPETRALEPIGAQERRAEASLRRLKHLEGDVACSIENECGIDVARGVDVYRLVLLNPESQLRKSTRVLLVTREAFLCERPAEAVESSKPVLQRPPRGTEATHVFLCFFRATPKGPSGASRLLGSNLPVLHVHLSTPSGRQDMEFIGKHQRRYYAESQGEACDALAEHLTESLLRVALEFVFHPSRSRFASEHLVVHECSVDEEALCRREELLPRMLESLRESNEKLGEVTLQLGGSWPSCPLHKERSFVVLDEDVLKVVPAKEHMKAAAQPSFSGLSKGFLQAPRRQTAPAAEPAAPPPSDGRPVSTSREDKQRLLMPAASPGPGSAAAARNALVSQLQAEAEPEEEPEELGAALDISELATQLFGEADVEAFREAIPEPEAPEVPEEPEEPDEPEASPPTAETERDDLVALWMKQRW